MALGHFLSIYLSVSVLPTILQAYICHIYDQKLGIQKDNRGLACINWASPAPTALQIANCEYCIAYVENKRYYAGCVQAGSDTQTRSSVLLSDKFRTICTSLNANSKVTFDESTICDEEPTKVCCCTGIHCFDELRRQFSTGKSSDQASCKVYYQEFDAKDSNQPGLDVNQVFLRKACSLCKSTADDRGVEFSCVAGGQVNHQCQDNTYLVGGSLACNREGTQCCCRGEECFDEFRIYYFQNSQSLPKPRILEPYTEESKAATQGVTPYGPSSSAHCSATNNFSSIIPLLIKMFIIWWLAMIVGL